MASSHVIRYLFFFAGFWSECRGRGFHMGVSGKQHQSHRRHRCPCCWCPYQRQRHGRRCRFLLIFYVTLTIFLYRFYSLTSVSSLPPLLFNHEYFLLLHIQFMYFYSSFLFTHVLFCLCSIQFIFIFASLLCQIINYLSLGCLLLVYA